MHTTPLHSPHTLQLLPPKHPPPLAPPHRLQRLRRTEVEEEEEAARDLEEEEEEEEKARLEQALQRRCPARAQLTARALLQPLLLLLQTPMTTTRSAKRPR